MPGPTRARVTVLAASSLLVSGALASGACSATPPPATSAVILATPTSVCFGDDYRTPITLDGTQSTPTLTLVPAPPGPGAPSLSYAWTLGGSAYRFVGPDGGDAAAPGSLTSDRLTVAIKGDRPLEVGLTVTTAQGGTGSTSTTIAVTVPGDGGDAGDAGACPLGNPG